MGNTKKKHTLPSPSSFPKSNSTVRRPLDQPGGDLLILLFVNFDRPAACRSPGQRRTGIAGSLSYAPGDEILKRFTVQQDFIRFLQLIRAERSLFDYDFDATCTQFFCESIDCCPDLAARCPAPLAGCTVYNKVMPFNDQPFYWCTPKAVRFRFQSYLLLQSCNFISISPLMNPGNFL